MKPEKENTFALFSEIDRALLEEFHDPDVREVYCEEFLNAKIATQIKVLREQRGWTQEQLAEHAQMKQERVAVLENINYESWTLNVLRRFAKAYDLTLDLEFKEFGEFLKGLDNFSREAFEKRSFQKDPVFQKGSAANVFRSDKFAKEKVSNPDSKAYSLPMIVEVTSVSGSSAAPAMTRAKKATVGTQEDVFTVASEAA